jgi:large subunit ribosomal protein L16|uniref:ribosomal protein L16 n=1 Tax=Ancyromonas sigmoides TaxID=85707 RepID=UPI0028D722E5|nr:ribosomal protein L16 [Ancyromonas sigmoides]WMQ52559.1 ribosomal protein L16 [Ancyromonas sigmoides]
MKDRKGRIRGIKLHKPQEQIFEHILRTSQPGRLTAQQIEASRRILSKKLKKQGSYRIHVHPSISVSKKPSEVRMGKGKGAVDHFIARVKAGQILFSIQNVNASIAKTLFVKVSYKLPIQTNYFLKI